MKRLMTTVPTSDFKSTLVVLLAAGVVRVADEVWRSTLIDWLTIITLSIAIIKGLIYLVTHPLFNSKRKDVPEDGD